MAARSISARWFKTILCCAAFVVIAAAVGRHVLAGPVILGGDDMTDHGEATVVPIHPPMITTITESEPSNNSPSTPDFMAVGNDYAGSFVFPTISPQTGTVAESEPNDDRFITADVVHLGDNYTGMHSFGPPNVTASGAVVESEPNNTQPAANPIGINDDYEGFYTQYTLSGTGNTIVEVEPNDGIVDPDDLILGDDYDGEITEPTDEDWVRFTASAGTTIAFGPVTPANVAFELRNSDGSVSVHAGSGGTTYTFLAGGTYYIRVYSFCCSGDYLLRTRTASGQQDVDYLRLDITQPTAIQVTLRSGGSISQLNNVLWQPPVVAGGGLGTALSAGAPVTFRADVPGTYFFSVWGQRPFNPGGTYTLEFRERTGSDVIDVTRLDLSPPKSLAARFVQGFSDRLRLRDASGAVVGKTNIAANGTFYSVWNLTSSTYYLEVPSDWNTVGSYVVELRELLSSTTDPYDFVRFDVADAGLLQLELDTSITVYPNIYRGPGLGTFIGQLSPGQPRLALAVAPGSYFLWIIPSTGQAGDYTLHLREADHGTLLDGWLYIQRTIENVLPNVDRVGNDGTIAALGCGDVVDFCCDAGAAINVAAEAAGVMVFHYEGAAAINQFFADLTAGIINPAIIWLPGTNAENDLDTAEGAAITAHAAEIASFVNSGGGLVAHSGEDVDVSDVSYGWLAALFPTLDPVLSGIPHQGGPANDLALTPIGAVSFPGLTQSDMNAGPWHSHFEGNIQMLQGGNRLVEGMQVLAESNTVNAQGDDAPVIIGGAQVTFPENPILSPFPVHYSENIVGTPHTVTAYVHAQGDPQTAVSGRQVTFDIVSGPNAPATGTCSPVTCISGADGKVMFTYLHSGGLGVDELRAEFFDPLISDTRRSNPSKQIWDDDCDDNSIPDGCDTSCQAYDGFCFNFLCGFGVCGDGNDCTNDICSAVTGCSHTNKSAGSACGSQTDTDCDNPNTCNGSGTCLPNFAAAGAACGSQGNTDCDQSDTCNGSGTCLPNYRPNGLACGDQTASLCNGADFCNGSGACLTNVSPPGTTCSDSLFCNGADTCNASGVCVSTGDPCVAGGLCCNEFSNACESSCSVIYVDDTAPGLNNGGSWSDAYADLQDALDVALPGTEIWVATGTYRPSLETFPGDARSVAFRLRNGIRLYGGFAGGEVGRNQRNPAAHIATLSGDLAADDTGPLSDSSRNENSYHVVVANGTNTSAILDGFRITGGNANGSNAIAANVGGGIWTGDGSPTLVRCHIEQNRASGPGGGLFTSDGPVVESCRFSGNSATQGGGIYRNGHGGLRANNSVFAGNATILSGAGVYDAFVSTPLQAGSSIVTNCTFGNNLAGSGQPGAGIVSWPGAGTVASIGNTVIWGNLPAANQLIKVGAGTITARYSDVQNGFVGAGNFNSNPLFVNAVANNLRLSSTSPCIDRGSNSDVASGVTIDADRNTRRFDDPSSANSGSGTPPIVDVGAYEFGSSPGCLDDCDSDGICDDQEVTNGTDSDININRLPDTCEGKDSDNVPTGQSALVTPGGSSDPMVAPTLNFTNQSAGPASITAVQANHDLHPSAGGFAAVGTSVTIQASLTNGTFFMRVTVPFAAADLGGATPTSVELMYYDESSANWVLAVEANTQPSPGHPGPIGDETEVSSTIPPTLSNQLGDYGVYWHPTLQRGYVWANVDHATDFAATLPFGELRDCNVNTLEDALDIALQTSADCDGNGIPDECQADDDLDGRPNACDMCAAGDDAIDSDENGIPDACEAANVVAPDPVTAEAGAIGKVRFISFVVPSTSAGTDTAIRIELTDLYGQGVCCAAGNPNSCSATPCSNHGQCSGTFPACTQRLLPFEGQFRYVNTFPDNATTCIDSSTFNTSYRCATLGCQPEYRNWGGEVGGQTLHVTGDGVAPLSTYSVSHIADSCGAAPSANTCSTAAPALSISTNAWGDVCSGGAGAPDGAANVIDIGCVVNKVKETPPLASEPRNWLKVQNPDPVADAINVIDIGNCVDAVKGLPYPFSMSACP